MSDDLVKRLRGERVHFMEDIDIRLEAAARIEELEGMLAKAVEALEFYGNEDHYSGEYISDECGCCGSWYEPKIHKDGEDSGDLARTTLAELKGQNDE